MRDEEKPRIQRGDIFSESIEVIKSVVLEHKSRIQKTLKVMTWIKRVIESSCVERNKMQIYFKDELSE